jgi:hypothetical protein
MLEPIPFAGYVEIPNELTDDEIIALWKHKPGTKVHASDLIAFAKEVLNKADQK